jgi:hypothetical protein
MRPPRAARRHCAGYTLVSSQLTRPHQESWLTALGGLAADTAYAHAPAAEARPPFWRWSRAGLCLLTEVLEQDRGLRDLAAATPTSATVSGTPRGACSRPAPTSRFSWPTNPADVAPGVAWPGSRGRLCDSPERRLACRGHAPGTRPRDHARGRPEPGASRAVQAPRPGPGQTVREGRPAGTAAAVHVTAGGWPLSPQPQPGALPVDEDLPCRALVPPRAAGCGPERANSPVERARPFTARSSADAAL